MIGGMAAGNTAGPALAGTIPSAQQVGGAPPADLDKATPAFDDCFKSLMSLTNLLRNFRDDDSSSKILDLASDIKKVQLARRKKLISEQSNSASSPNPISPVQGLNAQGVPNQ